MFNHEFNQSVFSVVAVPKQRHWRSVKNQCLFLKRMKLKKLKMNE